MSRSVEVRNRRLLRARDALDRGYAQPLDVHTVAGAAHASEAHFIRGFRAAFGETPHRYLLSRRMERSMFLLRETNRSVSRIGRDVGFRSRGTIRRTFHDLVGETPSNYRAVRGPMAAPNCFQMAAMASTAPVVREHAKQQGSRCRVLTGTPSGRFRMRLTVQTA